MENFFPFFAFYFSVKNSFLKTLICNERCNESKIEKNLFRKAKIEGENQKWFYTWCTPLYFLFPFRLSSQNTLFLRQKTDKKLNATVARNVSK